MFSAYNHKGHAYAGKPSVACVYVNTSKEEADLAMNLHSFVIVLYSD